jgi:hypothetical protein
VVLGGRAAGRGVGTRLAGSAGLGGVDLEGGPAAGLEVKLGGSGEVLLCVVGTDFA